MSCDLIKSQIKLDKQIVSKLTQTLEFILTYDILQLDLFLRYFHIVNDDFLQLCK